jgi:hypothetical protein
MRKFLLGVSVAAGVAMVASDAMAGGALQWANAANDITVEGGGVGYALTGLAIIVIGLILAFSYHSLLTMALSMVVGGGLATNYAPIEAFLFPGGAAGAGGGSIHDVGPARAELPFTWQPLA